MSVGPPQPGESQQRVPSMVPGQQTGYQPSPAQPQPYQAPGQQVVYMQAPVNKPPRPPIRLTLDFGFLCTQIGVFKLIEFVSSLLWLLVFASLNNDIHYAFFVIAIEFWTTMLNEHAFVT